MNFVPVMVYGQARPRKELQDNKRSFPYVPNIEYKGSYFFSARSKIRYNFHQKITYRFAAADIRAPQPRPTALLMASLKSEAEWRQSVYRQYPFTKK